MRRIININDGWKFVKEDVGAEQAAGAPGERVNVPHTWNGTDGQDGGDDYLRTRCWYVKEFDAPALARDERLFLEFCAVNSTADVWLNGQKIAHHDGGYSLFRADGTEALKEHNVLVVSADNRANEHVYPQTADFTFYGGIYRDVNLVIVGADHFSMDGVYGNGLKITPTVQGTRGTLDVQARVTGGGKVLLRLYDAEGKLVCEGRAPLSVENVRLWNGTDDPYLYTLEAVLEKDGAAADSVREEIGFRFFSFDEKRGFLLNGREYPLRGVCRHQDRPGIGNALTAKEHEEDIALILEMGATTIRLAHYQHDEYFYRLCDRAGLVVWAEIPYISRHMDGGDENAVSQMRELIGQNYNHPCIVTWGVSNEITMKRAGKDRLAFHKQLNALCKELDPTRPTVIANFVMCSVFNPITHITDLASFNLYYGWYAPFAPLTGAVLSLFHLLYPGTPVGLSEYGAECMPSLHSARPRRGDSTEEYQVIYHEKILKCIEKRPWLWATHVWNMFDFASDGRDHGGDPGKNHKGLVTFDRKVKKDSFYLYKAHWSKEPFVHIAGKRFENRHQSVTRVDVFSNAGKVTLTANGKPVPCSKTDGKHFTFKVALEKDTALVAKCGELHDECVLHKVDRPDENYRLHTHSNNHSWEKKKK